MYNNVLTPYTINLQFIHLNYIIQIYKTYSYKTFHLSIKEIARFSFIKISFDIRCIINKNIKYT